MQTAEGRRTLLRGYLAAVAVYVAGHLTLWAVVYRPEIPHGSRDPFAWAVLMGMWVTFAVVAGRLALVRVREPVWVAAGVSSAAVLTGQLVRTALAALGMWEFFIWDHSNVIRDAVMMDVLFALVSYPIAAVFAAVSWTVFARRRPNSVIPNADPGA